MYDCSGTFINVWRDGKAIADLRGRKEGVEIFFLSVHNKMTLNVPWTPIHPTPNGSAHGGLYRKKRHLKLREYLVI